MASLSLRNSYGRYGDLVVLHFNLLATLVLPFGEHLTGMERMASGVCGYQLDFECPKECLLDKIELDRVVYPAWTDTIQHGLFVQGFDISEAMLGVASEREVEGDLCLHDMGQGMPLRAGIFDGAISISAVQWLCNAVRLSNFLEYYALLKHFNVPSFACILQSTRPGYLCIRIWWSCCCTTYPLPVWVCLVSSFEAAFWLCNHLKHVVLWIHPKSHIKCIESGQHC